MIDAYFEGFPADAASEVRQRFQSKDVVAHRSAVFEIIVHEVAMRVGCRLSAHPVVHGVTTHPDFLAEEPGDSPSFYLEAIVPGPSEDEAAAAKREAQVYALLDQMASPDFFLNVTIRGNPGTPVPTSKIRKMLAEKMAALDRDEIASMPAEDVPRWPFEHDGWELDSSGAKERGARQGGPADTGHESFRHAGGQPRDPSSARGGGEGQKGQVSWIVPMSSQ